MFCFVDSEEAGTSYASNWSGDSSAAEDDLAKEEADEELRRRLREGQEDEKGSQPAAKSKGKKGKGSHKSKSKGKAFN